MGKSRTTTNATRLDNNSQRYVDHQRSDARAGADMITGNQGNFFLGPQQMSVADQIAPFMNPYMDQVIGGVRNEFDHLRGLATRDANDQAIRAGAVGGSGHGIMTGTRLGALDRAEGSQVGDLLRSGFNTAVGFGIPYQQYQHNLAQQQAMEPVWRQQQAQGLLTGGRGPVGQVNTQTEKGSTMGTIAGIGMGVAGLMSGNPMAAASMFRPSFQGGAFNPPGFYTPGGTGGPNPLFPGGQGTPYGLPGPWGSSMPSGPSPLWRG